MLVSMPPSRSVARCLRIGACIWVVALCGSLRAQVPAGGISAEDLPVEGDPIAPSQDPEPADPVAALEAQARTEYADGNLASALALYLELATRHPDPQARGGFRVTAAWLSMQLGDTEAARHQLGEALFADPALPFRSDLYSPDFTALYQDQLAAAVDRRAREATERTAQAVDAIRGGRLRDARAALEAALELAPSDPEILYNLALVDLRERRSDAALAGFERVLALERGREGGLPRNLKSQALNNIAVLYFARADYEVARDSLQAAIELDPADARAWFNLGLTRQKLGDAAGGHAALRRARELDRSDVDIARALASSDIDRGDWVEAVALLLEGTRARPEEPELWLQLGRAQRGLGNADGALSSWESAARLDPDNRFGIAVPALRLRADLLLERGDGAAAGADARRIVDLDADNVDGWMLLGLARKRSADLTGAREALERARQLAPQRADVAQNLGSVYLDQKDLAAAQAAFEAVLSLEPDNAEARRVVDSLVARQQAAAAESAPPARGASRPPARGRGDISDLGWSLGKADYAALRIEGLVIENVEAGGAAARCGLRAGDLILRVDNQPPPSIAGLQKRAVKQRNGVLLHILRAGKPLEIRLRLDH